MSFEQRVSEAKPSKCGTFTVRTVKFGNKVFGHIESPKAKPGIQSFGTYWGSHAAIRVSERDAGLHVARNILGGLRTYGVAFVGLRLTDGTTYLAKLDGLFDRTVVPIDPTKAYIVVPSALWERTLPPEDERVANTLSKMRVAGGRSQSSMTAAA